MQLLDPLTVQDIAPPQLARKIASQYYKPPLSAKIRANDAKLQIAVNTNLPKRTVKSYNQIR